MKILITVSSLVFIVSSCKKNYVCECQYGNVTANYDLGKLKKKDAKPACEAKGESIIAAGGTCEAKQK